MANKIIHGFNVEYTEDSETAKLYLDHMENSLSREEVKAFVERAKSDPLQKMHLEDRHGNKLTLEYKGDNSFLIRERKI